MTGFDEISSLGQNNGEVFGEKVKHLFCNWINFEHTLANLVFY